MRKKLALLCLATMLTGCGASSSSETATSPVDTTEVITTTAETTTEEPTTTAPVVKEFEASAETVKLIGRTKLQNHVLWMCYSASGVEFNVTGKAASMMLYGDTTSAGDPPVEGQDNNKSGNKARFAIYIDDELFMDSVMDEGAKTITLFEGEEDREAKVRFIKLSETANSSVGIRSIDVLGGEIKPTQDNDMLIEFIGDSITCGYGVDDEEKSHHFSTSTEDATKAYAYQTAKLLGADYSLVSISGYGIISGYSSNGERHADQMLSKYYDKVGFSYAKAGGFTVSDWEWDFSTRQPDIVVLNLGTNDSSYVKKDEEKKQLYIDEYVSFLKVIREKNPKAKIICALGIMGDELYPAVETAVKKYSDETKDVEVYPFHFEPIKSNEGYAADWHPTAATHDRCAKALSEYIKTLI